MLSYEINQACVRIVQRKLSEMLNHLDKGKIDTEINHQDIFKLSKIDPNAFILYSNMAFNDSGFLKCFWLGLDKDGGPSRFFIMDYESNGRTFIRFIVKVIIPTIQHTDKYLFNIAFHFLIC